MLVHIRNIKNRIENFLLIYTNIGGFHRKDAELKSKYYSKDNLLLGIHDTSVILMIDGRYIHGGLSDRLRGIATIYGYCKEQNIPFFINHVFPFELQKYLLPNSYDWRIPPCKISYNTHEAIPVCLNSFALPNKYHRQYLDIILKRNVGKQIHLYTTTRFFDKKFSSNFEELFRPTQPLLSAMETNLHYIGNKYVAMVFRFQQLLGDFKEDGYKTLSEKEQAVLIEKCISKVEELQKEKHPDTIVLVTSDSGRFLQTIVSRLDYVRIIPGKVVHMDHTDNAAFDTYMKSFVDLFLLAKADKIYLLQTGDMYHSGFAQRAAMINDRPYEEVIF